MAYDLLEMENTGSATQNNGKVSNSEVRVFKVTPYTAIPELEVELLGGFDVVGGRLVRTFPNRHPLKPWLVCTNVEHKSFDVLNGWTQTPWHPGHLGRLYYSNHAVVTATYTSPDYTFEDQQAQSQSGDEQSEIQIASESWDYGSRAFTLPHQFYKWKVSGDLARVQENQCQITIPNIKLSLIRHYCLNKPSTAITQLSNKLNKSTVQVFSDVFAPGMVMFKGAAATRKLTTAKGYKFYEITYLFEINPIYGLCANDPGPGATYGWVTWQRIFNAERNWWEPMVNRYDNSPIYEYDEDMPSQTIRGRVVSGFNLLFNPGAV